MLNGSVEARTVSPAYALQVPAAAMVASSSIEGNATFCSVIAADDEAGPVVVHREAAGSWWVSHRTGNDRIFRPAGATVSNGPASFDGVALAVLGADDPHTIVAFGAGTLHLAGRAFSLGADDIHVARLAPDGTWTTES
ncbi:MAG: hypothetical protein U5K74_08895 [Gemmatimonadaceae bacterium]|nr:hypothetical protein [Gemmatimonadaceae bacterium]